jgi:DHA2 family multidrug resistance protein
LVVAFLLQEACTPYPLIHLRVLVQRQIAVPAILLSIFGFGVTATSFVLPDFLTRVQGLRAIQINDALNWIALPQIVLVPLVALLLKRIDARLLLAFGFVAIGFGTYFDTNLTHDWVSGDFVVSQCFEAVGLAFAVTSLITYTIANINPAQAAAIAATVQIARLIGNELGSALIQTFVRMREQLYSNLIGLHLATGATAVEDRAAAFAAPFIARATGLGDPVAQGTQLLGNLVRREAYVRAYIDAFWLITMVSAAGILLILLLHPPPPNPLTPPRIDRA